MKEQKTLLDWIEQNRVLSHTFFWLFLLLIAPLTSNEGVTEIGQSLIYRGVALPVKIIATYWLVYYEIPLLKKGNFLKFVLLFAASTVLFIVFYRICNVHIAEVWAGDSVYREPISEIVVDLESALTGYFFKLYSSSVLFVIIKNFKDRAIKERQINTLKSEKALTELSFLKAQIHPHFLFNTLNNLYVLTLDKSDDAPEVVEKLSDMLDYMLYQCNEQKVSVGKEIALLENYLALEKLRYGNRLELSFEYKMDDYQAKIAPLILISMVENAFKHGVSSTISQPEVTVSLKLNDGILDFKVMNTKSEHSQSDDKNYKEGIGLTNMKRQLELVYPNQYKLKIKPEKNKYQINLKLKL